MTRALKRLWQISRGNQTMTDQKPSGWAVTGKRTPTAGHGECHHQLVISKPDVPVQLLVDDCRNHDAQKLFADYVCGLLNRADAAGKGHD